jgi:hypothetical protein
MTTGTKTLIEYVARMLKEARPDLDPEVVDLAKNELLPRLLVVFDTLSDKQIVQIFADQVVICDRAHRYYHSDGEMHRDVAGAVEEIIRQYRTKVQ